MKLIKLTGEQACLVRILFKEALYDRKASALEFLVAGLFDRAKDLALEAQDMEAIIQATHIAEEY